MIGDLKYGRTVHSLAIALSNYNVRFMFVAPTFLQMPEEILKELDGKGKKYSLHKEIMEVIKEADIVYMTRIQKERFSDYTEYEKAKDLFILNEEMLKGVRPNMKILHPLPRVNEIPREIDHHKEAYYFEQAENGIPVRQAIICLALGAIK
jgi:aspartate carbamoyltransferase catalytic subunit